MKIVNRVCIGLALVGCIPVIITSLKPTTAQALFQPSADLGVIPPPDHPHIKGRYSVTWQEVGGEVKTPFSLMILKDGADGHCYLIDGTLLDQQIQFGPQVPCE